MKHTVTTGTFILCFLLLTGTLWAQQIDDSNPSIRAGNPATIIRQIEIPLERYNEYMRNAGLDELTSESELVTENNTIVLSYEIPNINKKKKETVETGVPAHVKHFLQSKPKQNWAEEELLSGTFIDGVDYDEDGSNNGSFTIPPDPHGAVGTTHVCYVLNRSIDCYTKSGNQLAGFSQSLSSFFSPLSPENGTFDPKIIWDQYENRFVAVTLVRSGNISRVLLAVSATANPGGTWYYQAIDAEDGGCWFDYPGIGVDDKAIYITGNYFSLTNNFYCESNVFIIDKGVNGGIYDGVTSNNENPATNNDFDFYNPVIEAGAGSNVTLQPAHMFGTPPSGKGAFIVSYSGITNGVDEFIQNFTITNPLSSPTFDHEFIFVGDIGNTSGSLPDAPQPNTNTGIETNDRRALNAVWQNNDLWVTATIRPNTGANAGQATAYWAKLNVDGVNPGSLSIDGEVGGEDIATGATTFFPSIAVNSVGDAGLCFSAGGSNTFAGAYGTLIDGTTGAVQPSVVLKEGVDDYERTFGGGRNRWGDYSKMSIDPVTDLFWGTSLAAIQKGSPFNGEDGRWQAFVKEFTELVSAACPTNLAVNDDPIAAGTYQAANTLTSTGRSIANRTVIFEAGQTVQLLPGFEAENNTNFTARIGGCANAQNESIVQLRAEEPPIASTPSSIEDILIAPNPSRLQTNITFTLEEADEIAIQLHDLSGRQILQVAPPQYREAGEQVITLNTTSLHEGMYVLVLRIGNDIQTQKLSVMK